MPDTLSYFPEIYSDELIYSVIARYIRHSGIAQRPAKRDLLDDEDAPASIEFPKRLAILSSRMPSEHRMKARTLVRWHTLLPYYASFSGADQRRSALREMIGSDRRRNDPHPVGGVGSRIRHLRFCPACSIKMQAEHGEYYWRRTHQVTSAAICPDHGVPLRVSSVAVGSRERSFIASTESNCPADAPTAVDPIPDVAMPVLRRVAEMSDRLLTDGLVFDSRIDIRKAYHEQLAAKGLMRSNGTVDVAAVLELSVSHFVGLQQVWPSLFHPDGQPRPWLKTMLSNLPNFRPPVKHLLLLDLIQNLPDRPPPTASDEDKAFGPAPWPCFNPIADHYNEHVITDVERYHLNQQRGRVEMGRFACSCGYVYLRSRSPDGSFARPTRVEFGPLLPLFIAKAVSEKRSLGAVARELRMEGTTLLKTLGRLEIPHPWSNKPFEQFVQTGESERLGKPAKPKSTARKRLGPRNRGYSLATIAALDDEWSAKLSDASTALRSRRPEVRVTWNALRLEARFRLKISLDRLPKVSDVITTTVEQKEDFNRRRIVNALANYPAGERPSITRIAKQTGNKARIRWAATVVREYDTACRDAEER